MATRAMIDEFFAHKELALVRPSPSKPVAGAKADEKLRSRGYDVSVVYLDKSTPAPRLADVKDHVAGVIIAVPKDQCEAAVREAIEAKIPRIWLQAGCQSKPAIALCEKEGVPTIDGACVMMYAEPVESVCAFHRWIAKLLGTYAK